MAPQTVDEFLREAIPVLLPRTGMKDPGASAFMLPPQAVTQEEDGRSGKGLIRLHFRTGYEVGGDILLEYKVWGDKWSWDEGIVALYLDCLPRCRHEFFIDYLDGKLHVYRPDVLHKRRSLSTSVAALLCHLTRGQRGTERSADIVSRRLEEHGYPPDIDGLCQLIGYANTISTNFMYTQQPDGTWLYEIEGVRAEDWGVRARVDQLPPRHYRAGEEIPRSSRRDLTGSGKLTQGGRRAARRFSPGLPAASVFRVIVLWRLCLSAI